MKIYKFLIAFTFLLLSTIELKAQTFIYSYTDPCTGLLKSISVPTNGVTVTYFGEINTFNPEDFNNGTFNVWANNVFSSFGGNNPCGSTVGISTSINMAQNSAMSVLGILNSLDVISSISGGGMNTNGVTESSKTSGKSDKKNNKKNNNQSQSTGTTAGTSNGSSTESTGSTGTSNGSSNGSSTESTGSTGTSNGSSTESTGSTGTSNGSSTESTGSTETNGSSTESTGSTGTNGSSTESTGSTGTNGSSTESTGSTGTNGSSTESNGSTESTGSTETNGSSTESTGSTGTNGSSTESNGSTNGSSTESTGSTNGSSTESTGSTNGSSTGSTGSTNGSSTESTGSTNGSSTESTGTSSTESTGSTNGSSTESTTGTSNASSTESTGTGTSNESGTENSSNNSETEVAIQEEKPSSNVLGGSVGSVQNSTNPTKGNAPTIVLSSDFAGFNFKAGDVTYGGKGTAGWTSVNWSGTKSYGFMLDYTSANRGPNFTAFYASIKKKRIDLISGTGTVSFFGKGSLYGTLAIGQMWSLDKSKKLKVIYMATSSVGNVFETKFIGTAFIAGGMYDLGVGKRLQIKFTNLFIYAPYISYYNDMVLKSPYVIMPLIGTNIGITKKFKLNVNLGGTYAVGEDVLNFTFMMGTRFAI